MCQKEMEACLKHLEMYNKAIIDLVEGVERVNNWVDKRAKETEELKGRVLELETRNILLEAKVRDSMMVKAPSLSSFLGGIPGNSRSLDAR